MADYISKQAFLKKLDSPKVIDIVGVVGIAWAKSLLNKIPTADVQEVMRGKWIKEPQDADEIPQWFVCSICGCWKTQHRISKYCPDCGAKMDGKEQDNDR